MSIVTSTVQPPEGSGADGVVERAASVLDETVCSPVQLSEAMLMMDRPLVSPISAGVCGVCSMGDATRDEALRARTAESALPRAGHTLRTLRVGILRLQNDDRINTISRPHQYDQCINQYEGGLH